jgi:hypothetical protein
MRAINAEGVAQGAALVQLVVIDVHPSITITISSSCVPFCAYFGRSAVNGEEHRERALAWGSLRLQPRVTSQLRTWEYLVVNSVGTDAPFTFEVMTAAVTVQNYVGSQIAMFANGLAHRLGQHGYHLPTDVYKESAREVFQLLISEPSPRRPTQRVPDMQLVFRHDCLCAPPATCPSLRHVRLSPSPLVSYCLPWVAQCL